MFMDNLDDIKKLITDKEKSDGNSDMDDKNPKDIPIPVPSVPKGKKTKKDIIGGTRVGCEDISKVFDLNSPYYLVGLPVKIKKLYPDVVIPEYKHNGDACCDIRAYRVVKLVNDMGVEISVPDDFDKITMYQGYKARIGTGFVLGLPDAWCANIEGRSGFSFDEGIVVSNAPGKAECIYKGEIMVNLIKIDKKPTVIHKNDRIAQMEIVPQYKMSFEETTNIVVEEGNERGEKGLGSSGVK